MKTLFITQHYLDTMGGAAFASRALINAFAQVSESITVLYPSKKGGGRPDIDQKVQAVPVLYQVPSLFKLLNIYTGRIHRNYDIGHQYINKAGLYDTVVFDNSITSHRLVEDALNRGLKVITIHHNCQYDLTKDNTIWYLRLPLLYWVNRAEREAVLKSNLNIALTEDDSERLKSRYSREAHMAVIGMFEPESVPLPFIDRDGEGHQYIITGNLSVKQTVDTLYAWIRTYYPILESVDNKAHLTIAGRDPQKELYSLCNNKSINIVASPKDMSTLLKEADFYICPIWKGSGIKLRIMDGLKFGIPVLTHERSVRGYEMFISKGVFTYKDANSFEKQLKQLGKDRINREDLQKAYKEIFSYEAGVARLQVILRDNCFIE